MTVQTEVSRSGPYAGAGTTGPFTVGFRFLADTHLRVIKTDSAGVDTDLALGTDFTVSGAGGTSGTVTTGVAIAVGESITIIRNVPFTQEADYVDNDAFPAESHEAALDLLTMQTQQIKEAQDRALALPPTADVSDVSTELPLPIANNILGWNSTGDSFTNYDPSGLAGIVSFGTFKTETFDGDGSTVDFILTADALVASNCDVSVGGVTQTPDIDFNYIAGSKTVRFLTGAPPAGTDNVFVRYGSVLAVGSASAVVGQTATGTALITAADAAAARAAIGVATATTSAQGLVELATDAEAQAKTDTARAITPSNLAALTPSTTVTGLVELLTTAELKAGTDTVRVPTAAAILAAFGFSSYFESAQQTITPGGALTIAHGLGRKPVLVTHVLQCVTAEFGFAVGDEATVYIPGFNAIARGCQIVPTTTNLNVRFGTDASTFNVMRSDTGGLQSLTNANWRLVVRAWG